MSLDCAGQRRTQNRRVPFLFPRVKQSQMSFDCTEFNAFFFLFTVTMVISFERGHRETRRYRRLFIWPNGRKMLQQLQCVSLIIAAAAGSRFGEPEMAFPFFSKTKEEQQNMTTHTKKNTSKQTRSSDPERNFNQKCSSISVSGRHSDLRRKKN